MSLGGLSLPGRNQDGNMLEKRQVFSLRKRKSGKLQSHTVFRNAPTEQDYRRLTRVGGAAPLAANSLGWGLGIPSLPAIPKGSNPWGSQPWVQVMHGRIEPSRALLAQNFILIASSQKEH